MTQPNPRQPAYDAVYAVVRRIQPSSSDDYGQAAENARVWRAVEAALDAMDTATESATSERWIVRTTFPNGVVHVFDAAGLLGEELAHQHASLTATQHGVSTEVIRRRATDEVVSAYPKQEPK